MKRNKFIMRKRNLNPLSMLFIGLLPGFVTRLFDIYTELLGNIFSSMAIWILFGTLIAIYSPTQKKAIAPFSKRGAKRTFGALALIYPTYLRYVSYL